MGYNRHFAEAIARLEAERRYRVFADLERSAADFPTALWHRNDGTAENVTIWCSNDYLGMGRHPAGDRRADAGCGQRSASAPAAPATSPATATRSSSWRRELADLHGKDGALVFTSGWVSNLAGDLDHRRPPARLPDPVGRAQPQFDDRGRAPLGREKRRSSATTTSAHLEDLLRAAGPERAKLIVFESLYSMDGDVAPLAAIATWPSATMR